MSSSVLVETHSNDDKASGIDVVELPVADQDQYELRNLGYIPTLSRIQGRLESFASSFCATNFVGTVRVCFFLGMLAGGPIAMWTSFLAAFAFMGITALVLREMCSALPISGSVYVWATQAAGPRYGRFVGCVVAWWITSTWISFVALTSQVNANYLLSLITAYNPEFPGGRSNDDVDWRTIVWFTSEVMLLLSVLPGYFLSPRLLSKILRISAVLIALDFILCVIWLPIGVSKTYGLRTTSEALLTMQNGTGAPTGWNWLLSFLFAAGSQAGFDAAGHLAEETKNASVVAAQSMFISVIASGIGGFLTTILFLFCTPDIQTLFSFNAPQPFVQIYTSALGRGGGTFMTVLALTSSLLSNSVVVLAVSRLVFSIARDGALPLSFWVSTVLPNGHPRNAVILIYVVSAVLLCLMLPSATAFFALGSGVYLPLYASFAIIPLLRLTVTPGAFRNSKYPLGRLSKPIYVATILISGLLFAVYASPYMFPVAIASFNYGPVVFAGVTFFGLITWWLIPQEKWLEKKKIEQTFEAVS